MPVRECSNGKWRIGEGACVFGSKEKAERAYRAYLAKHGGDGVSRDEYNPNQPREPAGSETGGRWAASGGSGGGTRREGGFKTDPYGPVFYSPEELEAWQAQEEARLKPLTYKVESWREDGKKVTMESWQKDVNTGDGPIEKRPVGKAGLWTFTFNGHNVGNFRERSRNAAEEKAMFVWRSTRGGRIGWNDPFDSATVVDAFDPDQPRDDQGRWTETGAGGGRLNSKQKADLAIGVAMSRREVNEFNELAANKNKGPAETKRYQDLQRRWMRNEYIIEDPDEFGINWETSIPFKSSSGDSTDSAGDSIMPQDIHSRLRSLWDANGFQDTPETDALVALLVADEYNPDQPRDDQGRWTETGGGGGGGARNAQWNERAAESDKARRQAEVAGMIEQFKAQSELREEALRRARVLQRKFQRERDSKWAEKYAREVTALKEKHGFSDEEILSRERDKEPDYLRELQNFHYKRRTGFRDHALSDEFNPDQPREPAGSETGGRWVATGSGGGGGGGGSGKGESREEHMARLDREIAETNRLAKEEFEANRREFERKVNEKLAESEKAMAEAIAKNREQNRQHQAVRLQRQAGRSDPSFVDLQNERFFDKDWRETSISAIAESKPWPVRPTVSTSEYVFSHAKSPRGSGSWMFEMTTGKGSAVWQSKLANYSEAKSRAVGIAKRIGAHTVKVMP